jgi:hypothetical protein
MPQSVDVAPVMDTSESTLPRVTENAAPTIQSQSQVSARAAKSSIASAESFGRSVMNRITQSVTGTDASSVEPLPSERAVQSGSSSASSYDMIRYDHVRSRPQFVPTAANAVAGSAMTSPVVKVALPRPRLTPVSTSPRMRPRLLNVNLNAGDDSVISNPRLITAPAGDMRETVPDAPRVALLEDDLESVTRLRDSRPEELGSALDDYRASLLNRSDDDDDGPDDLEAKTPQKSTLKAQRCCVFFFARISG